jgi:dTDP-4-dehydrorhamnose 3,5-epimerase-like enzyme
MKIDFIPLQVHGDERGALISLEREINIPFDIRRVYYIFDTKSGVTRGFMLIGG